jgi:hypothetical protein
LDTFQHTLADAASNAQAILDCNAVMDSTVKARNGSFICRRLERGKGT